MKLKQLLVFGMMGSLIMSSVTTHCSYSYTKVAPWVSVALMGSVTLLSAKAALGCFNEHIKAEREHEANKTYAEKFTTLKTSIDTLSYQSTESDVRELNKKIQNFGMTFLHVKKNTGWDRLITQRWHHVLRIYGINPYEGSAAWLKNQEPNPSIRYLKAETPEEKENRKKQLIAWFQQAVNEHLSGHPDRQKTLSRSAAGSLREAQGSAVIALLFGLATYMSYRSARPS